MKKKKRKKLIRINWQKSYNLRFLKKSKFFLILNKIVGYIVKRDWIILAFLTLFCLIIRVWRIDYIKEFTLDELYYLKTTAMYLTGQHGFSLRNPPLGNFILAIGIKIYGANWFGYRIMSAIFGTALIPLSYITAKELINKRVGLFIALIFTLEGSFLIYSRTAQIEIFLIFFIILSLYLFLRYANTDKFYYLILTSISVGFATALKYNAFSLILVFLVIMILRKYSFKKILWIFGIYLIIFPIIIYSLFFVIHFGISKNLFSQIISWHISNIAYNINFNGQDPQPYTSDWWTWYPLTRSLWFYYKMNGNYIAGINFIGNPIAWWSAFWVVPLLFLDSFKKNKTSIIILSGFIIFMLPFIYTLRLTFIYHAMPSFIFIALGISYYLDILLKFKYGLILVLFYFTLLLFSFIFLFPIWTAIPLINYNFFLRIPFRGWYPKFILFTKSGASQWNLY